MASHCFVVFTNPVAGREEEFNDWYSNTHLRDVVAVPGFVSARRFKVADPTSTLPGQYLTLYQMETDDPQQALSDLNSRVGTPAMMISEALDGARASATLFTAITDYVHTQR